MCIAEEKQILHETLYNESTERLRILQERLKFAKYLNRSDMFQYLECRIEAERRLLDSQTFLTEETVGETREYSLYAISETHIFADQVNKKLKKGLLLLLGIVSGVIFIILGIVSCRNSIQIKKGNVCIIKDNVLEGLAFDKSKIIKCVIPEGVTGISGGVFKNCYYLTGITIPEGVKELEPYAFENCRKLTDITIPDSVEKIGERAFKNCSKWIKITLPGSCNVGENLFEGCRKLTAKISYGTDGKIGRCLFRDCSALVNVTISDGIKEIGDGAFNACINLLNITIPGSVEKIGDGAFYSCSKITGITIPDSVKEIGNYAFNGCSNLHITCPRDIKIGNSAFMDCASVSYY